MASRIVIENNNSVAEKPLLNMQCYIMECLLTIIWCNDNIKITVMIIMMQHAIITTTIILIIMIIIWITIIL